MEQASLSEGSGNRIVVDRAGGPNPARARPPAWSSDYASGDYLARSDGLAPRINRAEGSFDQSDSPWK